MRDIKAIRQRRHDGRFARRTLAGVVLALCLCLSAGLIAVAEDQPTPTHRESKRSLPLPPRLVASESREPLRGKNVSSPAGLWSTVLSLGLVVGAIVAVGRGLKRYGVRTPQTLPAEAFEILGRRMIEPRVAVQFVKCGSRILVLGVGPEGARTLAEIEDAAEVQHLTEACIGSARQGRLAETPGLSGTPIAAVLKPGAGGFGRRAMICLAGVGFLLSSGTATEAQNNRPRSTVKRTQGLPPERTVVKEAESLVEPVKSENEVPSSVDIPQFVSPQQLGLSFKMIALMTVFSLAPSILMMTTCFVRFSVALGLLRQALGTQQGPPNQVLTAICLFLTFLVMSPVWQRCYDEGIRPYTQPATGEAAIEEVTALTRTVAPIRTFMSQQIEKASNGDAVWMLLDYQRPVTDSASAGQWNDPQSYDEVPLTVLAPAYLLSELKVGFLIGFQLFLPFLVIDLVVAMVLTSLGLTTMPPSMVSLPCKLLLFVMIDGWFLTVGMLLESVRTV